MVDCASVADALAQSTGKQVKWPLAVDLRYVFSVASLHSATTSDLNICVPKLAI